jgi:S1-C subfamily serine protease
LTRTTNLRLLFFLSGLLLLTACTISPAKEESQESLVPADSPIFDSRLHGLRRDELDLSHFWSEIDPSLDRAKAIPLHHRTFAEVAARAKGGVVNIYTRRIVERELQLGFQLQDLLPIRIPVVSAILEIIPFQVPIPFQGEGFALGSGFVLNQQGYILTNAHVIRNATDVQIVFSDRREASAKIVGVDPLTDTALIQVTADWILEPLPLGNSDALDVGEFVVAVGNPLGLSHTVTSGLVSATQRVVPGEAMKLLDFVQTDSAINPGSSGGPLLNLHGEVVGMNTAVLENAQGIGFAIPINTVKAMLPLLLIGQTDRGWLGFAAAPMTWAEAHARGLERAGAPVVRSVEAGGPAASAGLLPGDHIVDVNGDPVPGIVELRRISLGLLAGDEVVFGVLREDVRYELRSVLTSRES